MPYVSTSVGRLFVETRGPAGPPSAPPVLFWHSLLCDGGMWRAQVDDLARDRATIVVDGPGHGRSDPPPGPFDLDGCARAVVEILDYLGVRAAAIVGLSWGGMVAMRVALRAPERVERLALLDTSAERDPWPERARNLAMAALFRRAGVTAALGKRVLEILVGPRTRRDRPEVGAEIVRRLRRLDREGLLRAVRAVTIDREAILRDLGRIEAPVLVVVGEDDRAQPRDRSERIARAIPGARLEVVRGAGHLSALERPREVGALLRAFLSPRAAPGDA